MSIRPIQNTCRTEPDLLSPQRLLPSIRARATTQLQTIERRAEHHRLERERWLCALHAYEKRCLAENSMLSRGSVANRKQLRAAILAIVRREDKRLRKVMLLQRVVRTLLEAVGVETPSLHHQLFSPKDVRGPAPTKTLGEDFEQWLKHREAAPTGLEYKITY